MQNKPVVILSNNDGCIIARSNEAKALGIAMGVPLYQVRELLERENVAVFSSNYNLYGDMSRRVMCLLSEFTPDLVPYSIDEAFLDFTGVCTEDRFRDYGRRIVETVERGTGIPITIGIAPTKTLAKVAGYFGKKYPGYGGVCLIDSEAKRIKALDSCPIGKVWGIGRHLLVKMEYYGIKTAGDFVRRPESWVRRNFTVTGVRTWKELQGENCIGEDDLPHKKSICTSRSFPIREWLSMRNSKRLLPILRPRVAVSSGGSMPVAGQLRYLPIRAVSEEICRKAIFIIPVICRYRPIM